MTPRQTPYYLLLKENIPENYFCTDCYRSYNALDVSEFHHYRINHSTHFAEQKITLTVLKIFGTKRKEY